MEDIINSNYILEADKKGSYVDIYVGSYYIYTLEIILHICGL